jgi:hypothetical protein
MDIPMYYGWDDYKRVLEQYYQQDAEKKAIRYVKIAEAVDIGENYVSSMSKWLERTGFLTREEKGYYRLSSLGQQISEGISHGREYRDFLRSALLKSKNLAPLIVYLRGAQELTHRSLMNQIVFLAGIKRVQSHNKRGIDALVDALLEARILRASEDGLESEIYDPSVHESDSSIQQPHISQDKVAFLRSAIKLQGSSLLLPTEIEGIAIQAKKDSHGQVRPVIAINNPDLNCTYCLENTSDLEVLRTIINDKRIELLLNYLKLAKQDGAIEEGVFRV